MRADLSAPRRIHSKTAVQNDTDLLGKLLNTTPDQAEQWIQNNVNDLATARQVLGKMAKALVYLLQKEMDR